MGFTGRLVAVDVGRVGSVALITVKNNKAHVIHLEVTGISGEPKVLRVGGNDSIRCSCSVTGNLEVRQTAPIQSILFPSQTSEASNV